MSMRLAMVALLAGAAAPATVMAQAGGMAKASEKAKVTTEITEPANGATVSGPVKIVLKATGVEITPATEERAGTGHHHLFVDHDVITPNDTIPRGVSGIIHLGRGQTEFSLDSLKAGRHRVIDVVADWHHSPLKPMVADTVTFTVK